MSQIKQWLSSTRIGIVATLPELSLIEIMKNNNFDWIWVDAEHGFIDQRSVALIGAVCANDIKLLVRIPDHNPSTIKQFADTGCDALIIPQVNSQAEVDSIVAAAFYPPIGSRSVGISRAHGYGANFKKVIEDNAIGVIVQIETKEAVENLDDIISNPHIAGALVGPFDLSGSLGVLGDISSDVVQEKIRYILQRCQEYRLPCGIFAANAESGKQYLEQGFQFVAIGIDTMLFNGACAAVTGNFRGNT